MTKIARHCIPAGVLLWAVVLAGCSSGSTPEDAAIAQSNCLRACDKANALHCANDQVRDCAAACQSIAMSACKSQYDAVFSCGADASYQCTDDGHAGFMGCVSEAIALNACVSATGPDGSSRD